MKISIFDGWYADNRRYEITIGTGSIKVKERFEAGKILYETVSPLICYYQGGEGFKISSQKPLYINKLKIKIFAVGEEGSSAVEGLKIELLISS